MSTNCTGFQSGFQASCGDRLSSGVAVIHVQPYSASTLSTATINSANVITTITATHPFYTFDLNPETCSAEWSQKSDIKNSTSYAEGKCELVIPSYNYDIRNKMLAMASVPCNLIIERNDGVIEYWNKVNAIESKAGTGKVPAGV